MTLRLQNTDQLAVEDQRISHESLVKGGGHQFFEQEEHWETCFSRKFAHCSTLPVYFDSLAPLASRMSESTLPIRRDMRKTANCGGGPRDCKLAINAGQIWVCTFQGYPSSFQGKPIGTTHFGTFGEKPIRILALALRLT